MKKKFFDRFFEKQANKTFTVLSAKRDIKSDIRKELSPKIKSDEYWDNRGKLYGAVFASLNSRI